MDAACKKELAVEGLAIAEDVARVHPHETLPPEYALTLAGIAGATQNDSATQAKIHHGVASHPVVPSSISC